MLASQAPPARRRLWTAAFLIGYVVLALPVWYSSVRVPRAPLPHDEIDSLEAALIDPLVAALPSTITAYVICPGTGYSCLEHRELSPYAQQLGLAVLEEAGLTEEQAPLVVRVLNDAPGNCTASCWYSSAAASRRAAAAAAQQHQQAPGSDSGSSCMDLASSTELHRTIMAGQERDFDDWASRELAGQDRPGNYHVFVVPDPWIPAKGLPYGSVGRRRVAFVRYPSPHRPTHGSVVRLFSLLAAPAFASNLGWPAGAAGIDPDSALTLPLPLPLSSAAQLHLSFSLCNAHPSPNDDDDGGADGGGGRHAGGGPPGDSGGSSSSAAFTWSFPLFEAQFVAPLKHVLAPAARLTVSSQVLYFTPARVNASWDERRGAFVLPYSQLPFFVDSSWPLDPGRAGLPASVAAGGGYVPYDVATVAAGSRAVGVGEAMALPLLAAGAAGRAAGEAAAAETIPHLLPPAAAESLPHTVLHFVLYAPQPRQRPLVLLGRDGEVTPANSFRVPGWGMLQVLNQVPAAGLIVSTVEQEGMENFAIEFVAQLRSLLGLAPARRRLLRLCANATTTSTTAPSALSTAAGGAPSAGGGPSVGAVSLLSALRTGLAPWEVDALVRRRVGEDAHAAAASLGSLARLLRQVPTLALPPHVGALVREAVAALRRALQLAAEGRYGETSRAAQEARSWAGAAFADPSLSSRLNVPDTHMVGVYLPFCLPAAIPLLQALLQELRRRKAKAGAAAAAKKAPVAGGRSAGPEGVEGEREDGGAKADGGGGGEESVVTGAGGDGDDGGDGDAVPGGAAATA